MVGKLTKNVNSVTLIQSVNNFVSFAKVNQFTFLSNTEVNNEPLIH